MHDQLIWRKDRLLLNDLVFRLEHFKSDDWELGDECFRFYKTEFLVDQYENFWSFRRDFYPQNILELGVWDGGSVAFWFERFQPQKHVGIDIQQKHDSRYFQQYVAQRNLNNRIKVYWGTDQADSQRIREIVAQEFHEPLDLVIDDASHVYNWTKASFETLFPYLRPGGLYIIEDWAWGYWKEFQAPDHPWAKDIPLTRLITEQIGALGSGQGSTSMQGLLIGNVTVFQGFAVIERGELKLPMQKDFKLGEFITVRSEVECSAMPTPLAARRTVKTMLLNLSHQDGFRWLRHFRSLLRER